MTKWLGEFVRMLPDVIIMHLPLTADRKFVNEELLEKRTVNKLNC